MPPVTRVMVSRPLESPRKSAYEPFHFVFIFYRDILPPTCNSRVYGPKIGDVDEGIVEGCEDTYNELVLCFLSCKERLTSNSEDKFSCGGVSFCS
jgi:hypothetical protein